MQHTTTGIREVVREIKGMQIPDGNFLFTSYMKNLYPRLLCKEDDGPEVLWNVLKLFIKKNMGAMLADYEEDLRVQTCGVSWSSLAVDQKAYNRNCDSRNHCNCPAASTTMSTKGTRANIPGTWTMVSECRDQAGGRTSSSSIATIRIVPYSCQRKLHHRSKMNCLGRLCRRTARVGSSLHQTTGF